MNTVKSLHQRQVAELINSVEDKDIQSEMSDISYNFAQALAGLRLAKKYIGNIELETGLECAELISQINDLLQVVKHNEIGLLEMCSNY